LKRRVVFIDLARALAVVFMLYGHAIDGLLDPHYRTGTWFDVWTFQRGLTSCLFLLLSGFAFSIATARHWTLHVTLSPAILKRARRFGLFIVLGYALHFPVARFADLRETTAVDHERIRMPARRQWEVDGPEARSGAMHRRRGGTPTIEVTGDSDAGGDRRDEHETNRCAAVSVVPCVDRRRSQAPVSREVFDA